MKIQIIIGTTRQGRFSEKIASYMYQEAQKREGIEFEVVDLRDYPLPFFDEKMTPSMLVATGQEYQDERVKKWTQKIAEADGYIIVTGEYNHGYPAVLKNALDYIFKEWNKKAVGFVSYGNAGGARAVEQLRQVAIELALLPIRTSIQTPSEVYMAAREAELPVNPELFNSLHEGRVDKVDALFEELIWTTKALKNTRLKEGK